MRNTQNWSSTSIFTIIIVAVLAVSAPSCSRKSGCPAEISQTTSAKKNKKKKSKTYSGLGLEPKNAKKRK